MNAHWRTAGSGARDPFVAFVCDEAAAEAIRPIAEDMGWPTDKIHRGGLRNAVQVLSASASPRILFVDLGEAHDPRADVAALAEVCEPGTIVIAAGRLNDVRLYRDLLAAGVQDYLLTPLDGDALRGALAEARATLDAPHPADVAVDTPHRTVAVLGTRGGAGASSIAVSLAWLLSTREGRTTAMLDLDVHFGTAALALDLEPGRGLTDAIENPGRIDGLFIERAMVKASDRLSVLSAEAPIGTPAAGDGAALHHLQAEMRAAFEYTVIDLPRTMLVTHPHLVADIQTAVVVTELTLAGARDAIRLLSWLKASAPRTAVIVVANRVHPAAQQELARKDFEGSIERRIDHIVPFDQKLAAQAAKLGKPLAEVGRSTRTIAPLAVLARQLSAAGGGADARGTPWSKRRLNLRALLPVKRRAK